MIFTLSIYIVTTALLLLSFFKNKTKTKIALRKSWRSFENILPQFLSVLMLIGIILSILSPETISMLLGKDSGWFGVASASLIGSITLIPGFIAFPLASALLKSGAAYAQIAAFISTLMMVGVVTFPMEIKFFGKKSTLIRNSFAFVFSILIAVIIEAVLE
ncbi:MAG: permease [Candidatus Delongbacteria bacterium]|nr:permease [Candidatus Delongbacteria bacterium]MCG2761479.1 permease [Candidatus Delongbacteria bacterium]